MGSILATPLAKQLAKQKGISLGKVSPGNGRTYIIAKDVRALSTVRSTPAARHFAEQLGMSLEDIPHDGPRIYKRHVFAAKQNALFGFALPHGAAESRERERSASRAAGTLLFSCNPAGAGLSVLQRHLLLRWQFME